MKILITGISGTLGTAFTKLLKDRHELIGIDHNEQSACHFRQEFPSVKVIVTDFAKFDFEDKEIDLLIHLAAYKHIDICEENPNPCIENNVVKTKMLFENATKEGVKILFMSTDKAVEPVCVYGYTKALGEAMAKEYGGAFARSGNIQDSNGSVFRIWEKQFKAGKPIGITHPEMKRFFISADNLAKRIWEIYEKGEKLIIPEMDKNITIQEMLDEFLSRYAISLDNYEPGMKVIGLRAGEKLEERLRWDNE